ncbi:MAG: acetylglutamate kinase [Candidatus Ranarchaeia archaeon]|jgi:acetylglutamate kinase
MSKLTSSQAKTLLQALPYIQKFREKVFVLKFGGKVLDDPNILSIAKEVALLQSVGIRFIVVHGGGEQVDEYMIEHGKMPQKFNGRRITDADTLNTAIMVFRGRINLKLVSAIKKFGGKALGLSGVDADLITTTRRPPQRLENETTGKKEDVDFGHVGDIKEIDTSLLQRFLEIDIVPVICSLASDSEGNIHNVNADTIAAEIAIAMKAAKLIILTTKPGLLRDVDDSKSLISAASAIEIKQMVNKGTLTGGMKPKVEAALYAVENGVPRSHIINGLEEHSFLLEVLTERGIGTMILTKDEKAAYEKELSDQALNKNS